MIKSSFSFTALYLKEYVLSILKYILIGILGSFLVVIAGLSPIFAILALFISIPAVCFSFWKGYLITYAINFAAFDYIKKEPKKPFNNYINLAKAQEGELIKFVGYMAIIMTVGYLPTIFYFIKNFNFESLIIDPLNAVVDMKPFLICSIINTAVLAQFLNFALQAFFFKQKENYVGLSINCYKYTGFLGFIVSNIIIGFVSFLNAKFIILYILTFLPLNLVIYSLNLFLYKKGLDKNRN